MPADESSAPAAFGRDGRYETRRALGRGAAGVVYEAFDTVLGRLVAVKAIRLAGKSAHEIEEVQKRFRLEAQVQARPRSIGIVEVYDYGNDDDYAYIVMELVDGGTLKSLIGVNGVRPVARAAEIMRQLLDALDHCNGTNVVHRDIKPGNIMLTKSGVVKLADFGIGQTEDSDQTVMSPLVGTHPYMAPEQFTGLHPVKHWTDIYASGVVFYELLTGTRPFKSGAASLSYAIVNDEPVPPSQRQPDVPPRLDAVVLKALDKVPAKRFASAREFADAIARALPPPPPPPPPPPTAPPPGWWWLAARVVGVVGGLAAVVVLVVWLFSRPTPLSPPLEAQGTSAPPPVHVDPVPPPPPIPEAIAQLPCSAVRASIGANPPALHLRGIIGDGNAKAALDEIVGRFKDGPVQNAVQVFPPTASFCHAAEIVRAAAADHDDEAGSLRLSTPNGTRLTENKPIQLRVVMPDFPNGRLLLDYLTRAKAAEPEGSLTKHYLQSEPNAPVHGAGEEVDPGSGTRRDALSGAGPPFGFDMVMAIASSEPLFPAQRSTQPVTITRWSNESSEAYLNELQAAIGALKARGGLVSADALVLDTVAGSGN